MLSSRAPEHSGAPFAATDGHVLAAVDDARRLAIMARLIRTVPAGSIGGQASFQCVVFRAGRLPLVIAETAIASTTDRWEFRASGLWVEIVTETPGTHWSYGLEAFAVAIDRPEELLERGYGHRRALGWELDFEGETSRLSGPIPGLEHQEGRVDGLVLITPDTGADDVGIETPFSGSAERRSWSAERRSGSGRTTATAGPDPGLHRWHPDLPALSGPPLEVALPLESAGRDRPPVWWVGHDGTRLTSRWTRPT